MSEADTNDTDWDAVSDVLTSKYRQVAVEILRDGPATPSMLSDQCESDVTSNHFSRALRQLEKQGVVELLVEEDKKRGRLYKLTEKGDNVSESMKEVTGGR